MIDDALDHLTPICGDLGLGRRRGYYPGYRGWYVRGSNGRRWQVQL